LIAGGPQRRRGLAALAIAGFAAGAWVAGSGDGGAAADSSSTGRPERVLILSLPTLTWADLETVPAPTITRLLDRAAIADLATRADRQPPHLGAAYVTIGAGTRATGNDGTDGDGLEVHERFGSGTAGQAYEQRTGHRAARGLVDLGIARILGDNDALLYDAEPGALGDALANAGFSRAVIANGDGTEPDSPPQGAPAYLRQAVGALMDGEGRVPGGAVGPELLQRDPDAPYGVRFDPAAVERAFTGWWRHHSVVLVEASDLVRADRYDSFVTPFHRGVERTRAIQRSDQLVARMLKHVDFSRDAVIVVAPVPVGGDRSVTVAALRAPGVHAGLLRSATTRRSGFVTLSDVAPTILDLLGIDRPQSMEGRPMRMGREGGSTADRRAFLVQANEDGLLRDRLVGPATTAVGWAAITLMVGSVLLLGRFRWAGPALRVTALALVGFLLATLFATPLHLSDHGGVAAYWGFVAVFSVAFAVACGWLGRREPLDPLVIALGALLVVSVADQLTGAHLELNSAFGYSPTVGIRFAGIGNASSAVLTATALLMAALLAWRVPAPHGVRAAIAVLVVSFVALTPPLFGQDFGGTLAAAPAFALLGWMLAGRRTTLRFIAGLIGVLLASGLVVGFVELLRSSDQRTLVG
jgi:hypothetical protein